jgi:hypothetical protein
MVRFSAVLLLLLVGAEPRPPPVPPQHYTAPTRAVDHVAQVVRGEGLGPRQQGRASMMRHGHWLREDRVEEGRPSTVHSDFATGTSFTYVHDAQGGYRHVWIVRVASTARRQRYQRVRTGRRARALGARCEIWDTREIGEPAGEGPEALSCDTADGVTLWTRTGSARYGTVFSNTRTLSFARRPVAAAAAEPPRDLLRLDFLRAGEGPRGDAGPDYRVELVSRAGASSPASRRILQRHGDWRSTDRWQADGSRWLHMYSRAASLIYEQEANGRPVMLQASRAPPGQLEMVEPAWLPMADRPAETVLGETCRWMRPTTIMSDSAYYECRAADGAPLRIEERSWGSGALFTATAVSRRRLSPAAFAPPASAVNWAAWGVTGRP